MLWLSFEYLIIYRQKENKTTLTHMIVNLKTKTQYEQEEEFEI